MEDRNCNCGHNEVSPILNMNNLCNDITDCNYEPDGINAAFGIGRTSNQNNNMSCEYKNQSRQKMLEEIRALMFAITDVAEYLNTHKNDRKAICLHREYCNQLKSLEEKYQRIYGPLSIYYPCNSWRWLEEPWPWEGEEN